MNYLRNQIKLIEPPTREAANIDVSLTLSDDILGIWGSDGYFQQINSTWEKGLGWNDADLRSRSAIDFVYPDDMELTYTAVARCTPGKKIEYENRFSHKDGSYRWLSWKLLKNENGVLYALAKDITDLKEAELKSQESERRFRAVFNQTFQLSSLLKLDGTVLAYNQTAMEFCQLQPEEAIGYPFWELKCWTISPDIQTRLQQAIEEAATGKIVRYKTNILAPDNSILTIDFYLKPILDEWGRVEMLIAEWHDITALKQAEAALELAMIQLETRVDARTQELQQANTQLQIEIDQHQRTEAALRHSEEQFRRVFDEAPIGMTLAALDDCYMRVNQSFCTMLGYTKSEAMALTFKDITHPAELELEMPCMAQIIDGEIDSFDLEKRYIRKNGEILWVNLRLIALRDQAGKFLYTLAMIEDITQRKYALEALQKSEARYRGIVEDQTELICRFMPDGTLTFVNDAYCRYFNQEQYDLIGQSFMPAIPEEDREIFTKTFFSLSQSEPIVTCEHRVILPSGEIGWQQWTNRLLFDAEGNAIEFQAVGRDITPLKQAEAEIRKALAKERELGELRSSFVSLVSHEFRTPLTTILSSSELLQRYAQKLSDEKKQSHHQRISTAVSRMTQLLDDVLTIGKAEAGKLKCQAVDMDLAAFCTDVVESMQIGAIPKHQIKFTSSGNCSDAYMDENLLRHVLTNLLSNAIKYSPQGGEVKFDLVCHGESGIFRIQDSGIGIPQEYLEHLFHSFQRAGNVGTIQGTGLGLAIVKKCVDLQGGKIDVASELKMGTTFTVTLPLKYQAPDDDDSIEED